MKVVSIDLAQIHLPHDSRSKDQRKVTQLANSIEEIGLLNPITVMLDPGADPKAELQSYVLVAGLHRWWAYRALFKERIPCVVVAGGGLQRELMQIDENLMRHNLSPREEGVALKRRKEIFEELHPETKQGGAPGGGRGKGKKACKDAKSASFQDETAKATGMSKRSVQDKVATAAAIPDAVHEILKDAPVELNASELKKLGKLPEEQQAAVALEIKAGTAKTVAEATGDDDDDWKDRMEKRFFSYMRELTKEAGGTDEAVNFVRTCLKHYMKT
jgi:ParB family chromosome partitioning protein